MTEERDFKAEVLDAEAALGSALMAMHVAHTNRLHAMQLRAVKAEEALEAARNGWRKTELDLESTYQMAVASVEELKSKLRAMERPNRVYVNERAADGACYSPLFDGLEKVVAKMERELARAKDDNFIMLNRARDAEAKYQRLVDACKAEVD